MSESKRVQKRPIRWMVIFLSALVTCSLVLVAFYLLSPALA